MATNLEEFREVVDGAPIELLDAARRGKDVADDDELRDACRGLIEAYEALETVLEERDIELG